MQLSALFRIYLSANTNWPTRCELKPTALEFTANFPRYSIAQAQETLEPHLCVLKPEFQLVPIRKRSLPRGEFPQVNGQTGRAGGWDVTEVRKHSQPENEFAVLAIKQLRIEAS